MKTDKTRAELLKLDGKTVWFDFEGKTYKGKIRVESGEIYLSQDVWEGFECIDKLGFKYSSKLFGSDGNQTTSPCTNIRLYKKTLDDLEQGDIVVNEYGRRKVLGVCGKAYLLSVCDDFESFGRALTIKDLKDSCYTLVTDEVEEKEEEVLELTLQDIADKFEVDVKTIKIKEVER